MHPSYMRRWRRCQLANSRSCAMTLSAFVRMLHHPVAGCLHPCQTLLSAPVSVPPNARLFPFTVRTARTNKVGFVERYVGLDGKPYLPTDLSPNATQHRTWQDISLPPMR